MHDTDIVLGQIKVIWFPVNGKNALLKPLYRLNQEDGHWQSIADPNQEFPNRGSVTWLKAPEDVSEGTVWHFKYEEHREFAPDNPEQDRYRIYRDNLPTPPYELLDLKVRGIEALCNTMNGGISLSFIPSHQIFLVVDEETWAGPLRLVKESGHWKIDEQQRNLPIPLVMPVPNEHIEHLKIEGRRRCFLSYEIPLLVPKGKVDWSPDELVIKRVLREVRKNDGSFAHAVGLTKKTIDQAVADLHIQEDGILNQQVKRASKYIADSTQLAAKIGQFKDDLLAIPAVQAVIKTAKEQAQNEALAQAQAELEPLREERRQLTTEITEQQRILDEVRQRIQEENDRAQAEQQRILAEARQHAAEETVRVQENLKRQVHARQDELRQLDDQIAERHRQFAEQVELADETLRERLAELVRRPQETLAEIAIMRAALVGTSNGETSRSCSSRSLALSSKVLQPPATPVDDEKTCVKSLKQSFRSIGLDSKVAPALHAAFLSGAMPLVSGDSGLEALERYASTVAGGRSLWVNVPPTSMEPADLLGRFDAQSGRVLPHPSGLLDLLLYAAQPAQQDHLFVVVLDGVNRAAVDAYLLPILACYTCNLYTASGRGLSLIHPGLISQDDPYAAAAYLQWPQNVLLAGTLIEGSATVPLPPAIWSHALLIHISESAQITCNGTAMKVAINTEVQSFVLNSWREQKLKDLEVADKIIQSVIEGYMRIPMTVSRNCSRFLAIAAKWLRDDTALRYPASGCLLPYVITSQQFETIEQFREATSIDAADLDTIQRVLA